MPKIKGEGNSQVVKNIISGGLRFEDRYIPDRKILSSAVRILKESGYRIVLTQGVYDLFHVGHKRYLESAKGHGDILIIGVDTDELTRQRKGPKRPFDSLDNRLEILASLRAVDIVTTRDHNEHMYDLIKTVQPDVLIMSHTTADFTEKDRLNLLKYCGEVKVLPAQSSTTTTAKLRKIMIDGAEQLGEKIMQLINQFLTGIQNDSINLISSSDTQRSSGTKQKIKTRRNISSGRRSKKRN